MNYSTVIADLHVPINLKVWPSDLFEVMNLIVMMNIFVVRCYFSINEMIKMLIRLTGDIYIYIFFSSSDT